FGTELSPKSSWYLHRRRRRAAGRRRPSRRTISAYRLRHRDQRLLRHEYDIRGRQLRNAVNEAAHLGGDSAENLVKVLEQRLDALVRRAGFAPTVSRARKMVDHNHFTVDGGKVNRPGYQVHPGETIEVRKSRRERRPFVAASERRPAVPPYLEVEPAQLRATLAREPAKDEVPVLGKEQFVVEPTRR
ncbi:MAG TPA: 30S ribosomal protein S4, partial [Micromonosporaceae bacterium]|nr:30S ribosomal protein S4 [Micromonosporaceae bacterium]